MDVKLVSWGTATASVTERIASLYRDRAIYLYLLNWNLLRVISLFASHNAAAGAAIRVTSQIKRSY